jgi:hypothetical protein
MLNKNKHTTVHVDAQHKTHEQLRKELWIGIAVAVARAENARSSTVPASWANEALKEFDKKFTK